MPAVRWARRYTVSIIDETGRSRAMSPCKRPPRPPGMPQESTTRCPDVQIWGAKRPDRRRDPVADDQPRPVGEVGGLGRIKAVLVVKQFVGALDDPAEVAGGTASVEVRVVAAGAAIHKPSLVRTCGHALQERDGGGIWAGASRQLRVVRVSITTSRNNTDNRRLPGDG